MTRIGRIGTVLAMTWLTLASVASAEETVLNGIAFDETSATITHEYLPLAEGDVLVYRGTGANRGRRQVVRAMGTDTIKGVECLRLRFVKSRPGRRVSYRWIAQDAEGGVHLFAVMTRAGIRAVRHERQIPNYILKPEPTEGERWMRRFLWGWPRVIETLDTDGIIPEDEPEPEPMPVDEEPKDPVTIDPAPATDSPKSDTHADAHADAPATTGNGAGGNSNGSVATNVAAAGDAGGSNAAVSNGTQAGAIKPQIKDRAEQRIADYLQGLKDRFGNRRIADAMLEEGEAMPEGVVYANVVTQVGHALGFPRVHRVVTRFAPEVGLLHVRLARGPWRPRSRGWLLIRTGTVEDVEFADDSLEADESVDEDTRDEDIPLEPEEDIENATDEDLPEADEDDVLTGSTDSLDSLENLSGADVSALFFPDEPLSEDDEAGSGDSVVADGQNDSSQEIGDESDNDEDATDQTVEGDDDDDDSDNGDSGNGDADDEDTDDGQGEDDGDDSSNAGEDGGAADDKADAPVADAGLTVDISLPSGREGVLAEAYTAGDTLQVAIAVEGGGTACDVYILLQHPEGDLHFDETLALVAGRAPMVTDWTASPIPTATLFSAVLPESLADGEYIWTFLLVTPGGDADDPVDVLASDMVQMRFE